MFFYCMHSTDGESFLGASQVLWLTLETNEQLEKKKGWHLQTTHSQLKERREIFTEH